MSGLEKKYWKGIEELENDPQFVKNSMNEFPEYLPILNKNEETGGTPRRDFLKLLGFGVAAVSLAACETPVKKAIPYVNKPEDVDPTIANWYASTFFDGTEFNSILVKTREGRPIKIEGNKFSSITKGGTSVRAQASVLSLYDTERLKGFLDGGKPAEINAVDKKIIAQLKEQAVKGGQIRLVTSTIISPSTKAVIGDFVNKYPTTKVVTYDAISYSAITKANQKSFGKSSIPSYDFSKAEVIVSFGADFLGTWLSYTEYQKQYAVTRKLGKSKKSMSRHYQFETTLSLSGANADYRTAIKPSQEGLALAALYKELGGNIDVPAFKAKYIDSAAKDLLNAKGKSLVVSGSNDYSVQILVNAINVLLENYGKTIDLNIVSNIAQGNDEAVTTFVEELKQGVIDGVIFYNVNPVYSHPKGAEIKEALKKVPLSISFASTLDETSSEVKFNTPDHHYLESWVDAEAKSGFYSLGQPTISPIYKTRQFQESLLLWADINVDFYTYIRSYWKSNIFEKQSKYASFDDFWDRSLHNGVFESLNESASSVSFSGDLSEVATAISSRYKVASPNLELAIYQKAGVGNGDSANNPWLQEFPDPITKATWDNYLTISPSLATKWKLKVSQGNTIKATLKVGNQTVTVPVLIQPGQAQDTVGLALGYGREVAGKVAKGVGVNAYKFVEILDGISQYNSFNVTVDATSEIYQVAQTQTQQTIMGRDIVQESILEKYVKEPAAGRKTVTVHTPDKGEVPASSLSLWSKAKWDEKRTNHFWGMVIDLNSCIGCGSCVISCQAENNVPVVGRDEVSNSRDMHWIRIDRYYTTDANTEDTSIGNLAKMEEPSSNPRVVFQPMMCQHCNNAPCETVCPVLATTHSTEGLNQMTYNRCIGTRYCANNCPYKVRRFNWFAYYENNNFDYHMNNALGKMVLNPDVTVRARGVMEKCSMCVQRVQEGKLNAKKEKRRPIDGEIETACSQSCPTEAIVFGDMNDSESRISKLMAEEKEARMFQVLDEINTKPSVSYLTKIRNLIA